MKRSATSSDRDGGHNRSQTQQNMPCTNLSSHLQHERHRSIGIGNAIATAISDTDHRPNLLTTKTDAATTRLQEQRQNHGSLLEQRVMVNQNVDNTLSNPFLQNSRFLSSQEASMTGMTFSIDRGSHAGETSLNPIQQLSNRNMSQMLLSPRGSTVQHQLYRLREEQKHLQNETAKQAQLNQMELITRATNIMHQEQQVNTALLVQNAARLADQQNHEIERLRREIRLMEQLRQTQQQQAPYQSIISFPLASSTNMISTPSSLLLPHVDQGMLRVNQSALNSIPQQQQELRGSLSLFQHLGGNQGTMTASLQLQQQPQYPSSVFNILPSQIPNRSSNNGVILSIAAANAITNTSGIEAVRNSLSRATMPPSSSSSSSLSVLLGQYDTVHTNLSDHQILLRQQIELFEATIDDVESPMRGRNKVITVGQVGMRCKHCIHVSMNCRQKGSIYFPSSKSGVYQAAQNMSTAHIANGTCVYMPSDIKTNFEEILKRKQSSIKYPKNGCGRQFWVHSISSLGLIDTEEHGIRFSCNWPPPR